MVSRVDRIQAAQLYAGKELRYAHDALVAWQDAAQHPLFVATAGNAEFGYFVTGMAHAAGSIATPGDSTRLIEHAQTLSEQDMRCGTC